jgi:hypothetical protein
MKLKYILLFAISIALISCKPEFKEEFVPSKGNADFTKYISLGNSLTAGYADGALYKSAQANSYPALLGMQFQEVGGQAFVQPVVESEQGVIPGKLTLGLVNGQLFPVPATDGDLAGFYPPIDYSVTNLGVPGAKVSHLLANGYGNIINLAAGLSNPYFVRFASSPDISVIQQAVSLNPTFFSLWIGNNDVLGWASTGGSQGSITPQADFQAYYFQLTQALAETGAKGVLANIPNITIAPYFNTVPINALVIDAAQASQMNIGMAVVESNINTVLQMAGLPAFSYGIQFKEGVNNFLIEDNNFPYKNLLNAIADTATNVQTKMMMRLLQFRQADNNELLILTTPQDSLGMGMGSFMTFEGLPTPVPFGIPNRYVLDQQEMDAVSEAIIGYNEIIANAASTHDWALVDIYGKFNEVNDGLVVDGITLNSEFVTGGIFSLDGLHLTARGNAFVANYFIEAINKKYNSSISRLSLTNYQGVKFPN